ncbi:MAG TPA: transglutaminase-like domain-containing protein [Thermodesulfobacteriota bacterium]|nr:transglutaminase-like domain-containing protein [Thermodesulfobacteriota bacterium]
MTDRCRPADARRRFAAIAARPDAEIDLAEAALVVAQEEYPDLDVKAYLRRLEELGDGARSRVGAAAIVARGGLGPRDVVERLSRYLYDECGFRGNREAYYDPRNSYLNEVLDRRTGIPITLALVYIEVGRRVGLPLVGIGFPGHFLVGCDAPGGRLLIDPFDRGSLLTEADCAAMLSRLHGHPVPLARHLLAPVGPRLFLVRMLRNLKAIYLERDDLARALAAVERILLLLPDAAEERRDRGLIHLKRQAFSLAAADLDAYLAARPQAADREQVARYLLTVRQILARLN